MGEHAQHRFVVTRRRVGARVASAARVWLATLIGAAAFAGAAAAQNEAPPLGGAVAPPPALSALRAERREAIRLLDIAWTHAVDGLVSRIGRDRRAEPAWRALQRSQELWTAHRDADCLESAPALLSPAAGRRATLACEIDKTRARAFELAERYDLTISARGR